jgi:Na+-driven multidrug efflux pump
MFEGIKRIFTGVKPYVEVVVARVLNHPGEQLGVSLLAARLVYSSEPDLLADVMIAYSITNFVYYVFLPPLQKTKGMIKSRIEEGDLQGVASAYVSANIVCVGLEVCSMPVLFATPVVLNLITPISISVRNFCWVSSANNLLALNNATDRQVLLGLNQTLYSLVSSVPNIALALGLSVVFVPKSGAVGFAYASFIGLTSTNILNKIRLLYSGKIFHQTSSAQIKKDLAEFIKDGAPNSLQMLIEMSSLTIFPILAVLLGPEYSTALQVAFVLNGFTSTISQGINTVSGRDIYAAKNNKDWAAVKRVGNNAALATGVVSAVTLATFSIFRHEFTGMFTSDNNVQAIANMVIPFVSAAESVSNVKLTLANDLRMGYDDNWYSTGASALAAVIFIGIGIGLRNSQKLDFDSGIFFGCMMLNFLLVLGKYLYRTHSTPQSIDPETKHLLSSDSENSSKTSEISPRR